jgi:ribosomal-protein-alanine N-acetyltransferase
MGEVTTRLVSVDDVPELTALAVANREFLAPTNPAMPDDAYTLDGQWAIVANALARHDADQMLPHVILDADGSIVGRINLNSVIRGAAQTASVGYWVTRDRNGLGIATAAVASIVAAGFTELGLHRVQGETLPHNTASQRVLERNGFERIGYAPQFLRIAGQWQDHVLYQRLNDAWVDPATA